MPAMHQILPNYRQMGPNSQMPISYNSAANMRPDSQLSCNSQTNVLNSPLVNTMRSTRFVSQQALSNNNQMVNYQNMPMPNGTFLAPSQATLNKTVPLKSILKQHFSCRTHLQELVILKDYVNWKTEYPL